MMLRGEMDRDDPEFLHNIPDILYKYRSWANPYHKQALTQSSVYFSSAKDFNDPFDCNMPYRWKQEELTEENIFKRYYAMVKSMHPDWTEERVHQECYYQQQQGLFHDADRLRKKDLEWKEREYNQYGILCLTSNRNNFLMWSHYADCHRGFAIGYDKFELWDAESMSMSPVEYSENLPEFGIFEDPMEKGIRSLHTKSILWSYEDEYRLVKTGSRTTRELPATAIKAIVLGASMSYKEDTEIISIAEQRYPDAQVFKCTLNSEKFEITTMQIR